MARLIFALICVLVLHFSKASCQDENWILFYGNEHSDSYYFNVKNIVQTKTKILVWVKRVLSEESQEKELISNANKGVKFYNMDKMKHLIDFKNYKYKLMASYSYLDEKLLYLENYEDMNSWDDIIPDSIIEGELLAVKKYLHIKN